MPVEHGYVTIAADRETGYTAAVGTIRPEALGDQGLAALLMQGDHDSFIAELRQLADQDGEPELQAELLTTTLIASLTSPEFPVRVAAVLGADQFQQAVSAWYNPAPDYAQTEFARRLLDSTVLAEHSDAEAIKAAGAVGAATVTATGGVLVALVAAGGFGTVILIASPVGLVLVGAGATYLTWRLLRGRRR